jgi:hypothetical protein
MLHNILSAYPGRKSFWVIIPISHFSEEEIREAFRVFDKVNYIRLLSRDCSLSSRYY